MGNNPFHSFDHVLNLVGAICDFGERLLYWMCDASFFIDIEIPLLPLILKNNPNLLKNLPKLIPLKYIPLPHLIQNIIKQLKHPLHIHHVFKNIYFFLLCFIKNMIDNRISKISKYARILKILRKNRKEEHIK